MKKKVQLRSMVIRERLIRKCKSQNWLAERLDVSTGYVSQLMDGSRNPSPIVRQKFLDAFPDCEFDDLFVIKGRK